MGCDIHFVKEKKTDNGWVPVYCSDYCIGDKPDIAGRNYAFFAELAGVRGESTTGEKPKGLPEDVSLATKAIFDDYGDGHSESYMTAQEFIDAYERAYNSNPYWVKAYRPEHALYDLLSIYEDEAEDFRIVFWFDS